MIPLKNIPLLDLKKDLIGMNKFIKLLFIICTVIMLQFSQSLAEEKKMIGVMSVVIGEAFNQNNIKLISGSKIFYGDTIIVKENSNTQILFLDETVLSVGEKSELVIDEFVYNPETKVGKFVSTIKNGSVKVLTGRISDQNPDNLKINVPAGVVGSRGTEFAVYAEAGKKSSVLLLGPGPQNQLGLVPGNINLTDGKNSITIDTPGLAGIMTK